MSLFTIAGRKEMKNFFLQLAQYNDDILSVILVGSGSVGFTDELSDLDFCVVINNDENLEKTMNYIQDGIRKHSPIIAFQQMLHRGLQVYILDNYLEIDIGYVTIDRVYARRGRWNVLFDRVGTVNNDMEKSWKQNLNDNRGKTFSVNIDEALAEYAGEIWHPLFCATVAIRRGEFWRAIGEMDMARNILIELKGLRHSLETKRYRDVDRFPADELVAIHKSMPTCLSSEKMTEALCHLVEAIYDELEAHCKKYIIIDRKQVKEYISYIL